MRTLIVNINGRPPTPNARPGNKWELVRWMEKWREVAWLAAQEAMIAHDVLGHAGAIWPLVLEREGIPAAGRRKKPVLELYRCTAPILYAVRYEMTFIVSTRRERDWDNAVASGKPLTDGLVAAGVLAGDSTDYIASLGRRVSFLYRHGVDGVEIMVEEGERPTDQLTLPGVD